MNHTTTPSTQHEAIHSDSETHHDHDHGDMSTEAAGLSKEEREKRMGIFHYNEANALLKQGKPEEAVVHYKMALHHAEKLPEIHLNLSTAYFRLKEFDKAHTTLKELQGIAPDLPALHYNLACYYSLTGDLPKALESVKHAFHSGKINKDALATDPDLESLRNDPAYREWFKTI